LTRRIWRRASSTSADSGGQIRSLAASGERGKRESGERGARGFIGRVLMAITVRNYRAK
jgi:hypothetical protein